MADDNSNLEEQIALEIREIYNSGNCALAVQKAVGFHQSHPNSLEARYLYAVMHGDYSYATEHSQQEKDRLLDIAKRGIKELYEDPAMSEWPESRSYRIKNEYFWFFELPKEQYELGLTKQTSGGHYSACVGASMMAYNCTLAFDLKSGEEWAQTSLKHFEEFEKLSPDWYNINYFSAQALACLGKVQEAKDAFLEIYRKQKSSPKADEIAEFDEKITEIQLARKRA